MVDFSTLIQAPPIQMVCDNLLITQPIVTKIDTVLCYVQRHFVFEIVHLRHSHSGTYHINLCDILVGRRNSAIPPVKHNRL